MDLGAFSLSLTVKDIAKSRAFYEALGFTILGGNQDENWPILKNGTRVIGLFQGMFEQNLLTFTPGWDAAAQPLAEFTDVRELQRRVKAAGVTLDSEVDESGSGPGYFTLTDPDGNQILFDQHV